MGFLQDILLDGFDLLQQAWRFWRQVALLLESAAHVQWIRVYQKAWSFAQKGLKIRGEGFVLETLLFLTFDSFDWDNSETKISAELKTYSSLAKSDI